MLKYVSKFAMDILPSVAATIIGAYIVNHSITAKPAADAQAAAASAAKPDNAFQLEGGDLAAAFGEHGFKELARVRFVFDDQDLQSAQIGEGART